MESCVRYMMTLAIITALRCKVLTLEMIVRCSVVKATLRVPLTIFQLRLRHT